MDSQLDSPDPGSSRQPVSSGVPKGSRGEKRKRTEEKEDEEKERREKEDEEKGRKLHCGIAHMLNRQITDNYLKDMKVLSGQYLEPAILCKCTSPSDIFDKLETKGLIGIGNYKILKDLLKEADLVKVLNMVEEMEKDIPPYTTPATPYEFEKVQTELKTWYSNNMDRIQPLPMCEWEEQDLEHIFTNLQVVEGKKSRPNDSSKEQSSRPFNDPEILDRIFKVTPPKRNICLIEGPAGIGKSTLCRQFAYLWSKDDYEILGHHFDLVGILEARSLTKDFRKSFVQELFPEGFQTYKDEICQHFETGKSLLIIDGVDELTADGELAITTLLKGKFFRNVHLIITGRSESVKKFLPYAKLHLEVKGFSEMNAEEYIHKYFRNDENNYEKRLLDRLRDGGQLSELMVNPFVTFLLCILVQEKSGGIPSNSTEIYHEVMWTICRKYVRKFQEQEDCSLDEEMLYNAACYVAYTGVRDDVFVFPENYLNSLCEGDLGFHLLKSGILSKDYTISRLHSNEFCYFPHRSFQEFFCGSYLEKLDLEQFKTEVLPLLPYSHALRLKKSILACLKYLLSTQVNKTKFVLERLFEIVAHGKIESIKGLFYLWIHTLLFYLNRANCRLDLVDFFRIQFNSSFKVARVFLNEVDLNYLDKRLEDRVQICYLVNTGIISKPFEYEVHLAICKMDLPPVTYFKDASKPRLADNALKLSVEMDISVMIRSRYFQTSIRLLEHFTKSNGVKMPFIHCCSIIDASVCLQKLSRLGVLTIAVTPNALNDVDLLAFRKDLTSVENKINIIFVFLEDRYDDSRFPHFISLMKGYSSDKVKIQAITLKPLDTQKDNLFPRVFSEDFETLHEHLSHFVCPVRKLTEDHKSSQWNVNHYFHLYQGLDRDHCRSTTHMTTKYKLPQPLHCECYDRFCPY